MLSCLSYSVLLNYWRKLVNAVTAAITFNVRIITQANLADNIVVNHCNFLLHKCALSMQVQYTHFLTTCLYCAPALYTLLNIEQ